MTPLEIALLCTLLTVATLAFFLIELSQRVDNLEEENERLKSVNTFINRRLNRRVAKED